MGMTREVVRKPESSGTRRKSWRDKVTALYADGSGLPDAVPEYGGARGTQPETGSTTIQG